VAGGRWPVVGTVPGAVATGSRVTTHNPVATAPGTVPTTDHRPPTTDP